MPLIVIVPMGGLPHTPPMRDQDAELHLAALEGLLDETIGLLERYGEDQWVVWLRTARRRLHTGVGGLVAAADRDTHKAPIRIIEQVTTAG